VALLLIFSIGLGIGLPRWNAHRAAIQAQVRQQQEQQREIQDKQELARDNALLDQVDQDVSQVVPEAMQSLSWSTTNSSAVSPSSGKASRQ
jgi:type II secretory pathway pseudopilin PulG